MASEGQTDAHRQLFSQYSTENDSFNTRLLSMSGTNNVTHSAPQIQLDGQFSEFEQVPETNNHHHHLAGHLLTQTTTIPQFHQPQTIANEQQQTCLRLPIIHGIIDYAFGHVSKNPKTINYCNFLTCVFVANMLLSISNTILLSLMVKTIQLDAAGQSNELHVNGQTWLSLSNQMDLIEFNKVVQSSGQSISLDSIESSLGRSLLIKNYHKSPTQQRSPNANSVDLDESSALNLDQYHPLVIGAKTVQSTSSGQTKSNYIAVMDRPLANDNDGSNEPSSLLGSSSFGDISLSGDNNPVEIVTNALVLSAIENQASSSNRVTINHANKRANQLDQDDEGADNFLEFNENATDGRRSITLRHFDELNLWPTHSASLVINENLVVGSSSGIIGTIEDNLDIQSRDGNLRCSGEQNLKLISKSASIKLISGRKMLLQAPSIDFGSNRANQRSKLFILDGLEFVTNVGLISKLKLSAPIPTSGANNKQTNDDKQQQVLGSVQATALINVNGKSGTNKMRLRAYNLILLANGRVMAKSDV